MIRIGCLGAARITPKALIAPAAKQADVQVSAIAARDAERARAFAETHDIAAAETDYESLIHRSDVDMIYNALPPSRHEDLTVLALKAGKPVLCEKPIASNAAAAQRMADTARDTGTLLMEAFHYRFHPAFQQAKDIVCGGDLGRLRRFEGAFSVEVKDTAEELRHSFALGGGALMDLGCYPVHWARTLMTGEPEIVAAEAIVEKPDIDLSMTASLVFDRGIRAEVSTSMAPGTERRARIKVVGADATLVMDNPIAPHLGYRTQILGAGDPITVANEGPSGDTTYDYQLAHFLACLRGEDEPLLTPEDAVANMTAIDAIYSAAGLSPRPG